MLKADLHIHVKGDPQDDHFLDYSAKEIIDLAVEKGYDVLSFTNHNSVLYTAELVKYADSKGILLIPGVERTIHGKHVLIYNINQSQADKIINFEDLGDVRKKGAVVVAPHPFFPMSNCLGKNLEKNIRFFDAIEYSTFCTALINFNKKAIRTAKKYNKPMVGNSDMHHLFQFGTTYSLIDSKKDIKSVLDAIKNNNIEVKSSNLSYLTFLRTTFFVISHPIKRLFHI